MIGVRAVVTPQAASAALSVLLTLLILGAAAREGGRSPEPQRGPALPSEAPAPAPIEPPPGEAPSLDLTRVPLPAPPPSSGPAAGDPSPAEDAAADLRPSEARPSREPPPAADPAPPPIPAAPEAPDATAEAAPIPEPANDSERSGGDAAAIEGVPAVRPEPPASLLTSPVSPRPPDPESSPAGIARPEERTIDAAPEPGPPPADRSAAAWTSAGPDEAAAPPPAAPAPPRVAASDAAAVRHGRVLLRLIESGNGPSIEVIWPDDASDRDRLAEHLRRCYGMREAILAAGGDLFTLESPPGRPWAVDLDRYSGFVRQPANHLTTAERAALRAIQAHHRGRASGRLVRVMRREVDALFLGGLTRLLGDLYDGAARISARYRLQGTEAIIGDIAVDGRSVAGEIRLAAASLCPA